MNDRKVIYLDDAIDALEKVAMLFPYRIPGNRDTYDRYNEAWNDAIGRAEMALEVLPSAQPVVISTPSYSISIGEPMEYVSIIRRKDCNSADFAGCSGAVCYCMEHGAYMFQWDYCGRAERINNGQAD